MIIIDTFIFKIIFAYYSAHCIIITIIFKKTLMKYKLLKNKIIEWAEELGFDGVGFSDINLQEDEAHLLSWLKNKFHGEMHYMEKHGLKRSQPDKLMPGTVRVISFRMNYLQDNTVESSRVLENKNLAYISRYALGKDYHSEMRNRLHRIAKKINQEVDGFKYRAFVDSAPVLEKAIGQKSGLGWIGKNTLLINKKNGSYFFLGEIYTNIDFEVDKKSENFCGQCSQCIDVCPTKAIIAPNVLDAKKCIAYLTIELKGSIPKKYRDDIGNRIFGCDDCSNVCPPKEQVDSRIPVDLGWLLQTPAGEVRRTIAGNATAYAGVTQLRRNAVALLKLREESAAKDLLAWTAAHSGSALVQEQLQAW